MRRVVLKDFLGSRELGSRHNGEKVRNIIKPLLDRGEKVILDFSDIELATQSFLDEIFGIFVRAFGTDYIKGKLLIENVSTAIKKTINLVISYSKKRHAEVA
ncbi:STAS-like domain-containing protein [Caminibacter sp.]